MQAAMHNISVRFRTAWKLLSNIAVWDGQKKKCIIQVVGNITQVIFSHISLWLWWG